ncbi:MAG: S8 family serine peptidase, partial [Candidatus Eisenbacteria bacterium]|nr:S8 family serine peptidase [Candidatus Eisenbacteria bacterium]
MRNSIHMRKGFGSLFGCALFVATLSFPQFVEAEVLIDPQLDCVLTRGFMTEVRTTKSVRGIKQTAHRTHLSAGEELPVFLLGNPDLAQLAQLGIELKTRAGRVSTATISPDVISRLTQVDGLEAIRLARYTKPLLDVSVPAVQADHVRELMKDDWTGHTGEGVVIGIIDSGIDTTHPDFQNPDGSTRIAYYWAQGDDFGPPPSIGYGSEWDAAAINASAVTKPDDIGHGTHVAGIAAGNGRATGGGEDPYRFPGLAPEATIIMVATDFREDHLVDAIDYIFDKALAMGFPAVVNMSLGTQAGPHDGTAAVDQAIDALSGSGKMVVAAAGNEGNDRIHAEITLAPAEEDSASLSAVYFPANPDTTFNFFNVEGYYDRSADLCVTVVTPGGARFGPYELGAVQADTLTGEGTLFLSHADPDPLGDTFQVIIEISDTETFEGPSVPPANGVWQFVFSNKGTSSAEVDLWMPLAFPMTANWTDQG